MDFSTFMAKISGNATLGKNQLSTTPNPQTGCVEWTFRRDTLQDSRDKLGIGLSNDLRLTEVKNGTLAASAGIVAGKFYVCTVNGQTVRTTELFWQAVLKSLEVRIALFEAAPIDLLLEAVTEGKCSTDAILGGKTAGHHNNNNNDEDEDEDLFSVDDDDDDDNNNNNNSDENNSSSRKRQSTKGQQEQQEKGGEPNYSVLLQKDPIHFSFLTLTHPLHFLWQSLKNKALAARAALLALENEIVHEEKSKVQNAQQSALDALDDLLGGSDSSDSDNDQKQQKQENTKNNQSAAATSSSSSSTVVVGKNSNNKGSGGGGAGDDAFANIFSSGVSAPLFIAADGHNKEGEDDDDEDENNNQGEDSSAKAEEDEKKKRNQNQQGIISTGVVPAPKTRPPPPSERPDWIVPTLCAELERKNDAKFNVKRAPPSDYSEKDYLRYVAAEKKF